MRTVAQEVANSLRDLTYDLTHLKEKNQTEGNASCILTTVDGWSVSDLYYIPSTGLSYHAGLMEIFFEAGLFHEIAIAKYLHSVPYLRFETSRYDYLYGKGGRNAWHKNYNDNLIMMHPIKLSLLHNFKERKLFCDTVVAAFFRNLMDISYFEARRENRI
ncbi:hypothetical protein RB195_013087 [Necator americanus]|uniref:Uncharacterized protein n=1 Tax=Necator americanus TaxID=51031 RepID=A0ABR1DTX2_NECAM